MSTSIEQNTIDLQIVLDKIRSISADGMSAMIVDGALVTLPVITVKVEDNVFKIMNV